MVKFWTIPHHPYTLPIAVLRHTAAHPMRTRHLLVPSAARRRATGPSAREGQAATPGCRITSTLHAVTDRCRTRLNATQIIGASDTNNKYVYLTALAELLAISARRHSHETPWDHQRSGRVR